MPLRPASWLLGVERSSGSRSRQRKMSSWYIANSRLSSGRAAASSWPRACVVVSQSEIISAVPAQAR